MNFLAVQGSETVGEEKKEDKDEAGRHECQNNNNVITNFFQNVSLESFPTQTKEPEG